MVAHPRAEFRGLAEQVARIAAAGVALDADDAREVAAALAVLQAEGAAAATWAPRVARVAAEAGRPAEIRLAAVRALAELGDAAQAPVLVALARGDGLDRGVLQRALETLCRVTGPSDAAAWAAWFRAKRPDRQLLVFRCSHTPARWVQRGLAPRACPACGPSHPDCGQVEATLTERTILTWRCGCTPDQPWTSRAADVPVATCPHCQGPPACSRIESWAEGPGDGR